MRNEEGRALGGTEAAVNLGAAIQSNSAALWMNPPRPIAHKSGPRFVPISPAPRLAGDSHVSLGRGFGNGAKVPTGKVRFFDGTRVLGDAILDDQGNAILRSPKKLSIGDHVITARYLGDSQYAGSSSDDFEWSVERAATSLHLTGPSTIAAGKPLQLLMKVNSREWDFSLPSGDVILMDGNHQLAKIRLGMTEILNLKLAPGTHKLTAYYLGDDNFFPTQSVLNLKVAAARK